MAFHSILFDNLASREAAEDRQRLDVSSDLNPNLNLDLILASGSSSPRAPSSLQGFSQIIALA
jgi:hypothetical protein